MSDLTCILFPGQGSQAHGMGRKLAEAESFAMDLWKKGEQISKLPLREIYWESQDESLMAHTRNLQPAITIVNLALWMYTRPKLDPAATAGHSLGEFSSLGAAKVLEIDKVLELVSVRGELMADADPDGIGTMYAVLRLARDECEAITRQVAEKTGKMIRVANYNTPGQFAISGHKDAMDELIELVRQQKGKAIPLAVSGAFHTPLMAEASAEFSKLLDKQDWRDPAFAIYCNVSGEATREAEKIHQMVRRQMTSSVLWIDAVSNQYGAGIRRWVEFGPKGVLTRMVRPILNACDAPETSYAADHVPNKDAADAFCG